MSVFFLPESQTHRLRQFNMCSNDAFLAWSNRTVFANGRCEAVYRVRSEQIEGIDFSNELLNLHGRGSEILCLIATDLGNPPPELIRWDLGKWMSEFAEFERCRIRRLGDAPKLLYATLFAHGQP